MPAGLEERHGPGLECPVPVLGVILLVAEPLLGRDLRIDRLRQGLRLTWRGRHGTRAGRHERLVGEHVEAEALSRVAGLVRLGRHRTTSWLRSTVFSLSWFHARRLVVSGALTRRPGRPPDRSRPRASPDRARRACRCPARAG